MTAVDNACRLAVEGIVPFCRTPASRFRLRAPFSNGLEMKSFRRRMKWSQERLAHQLGIDRSSVAHMENGRAVPRPVRKLLSQISGGVQ